VTRHSITIIDYYISINLLVVEMESDTEVESEHGSECVHLELGTYLGESMRERRESSQRKT